MTDLHDPLICLSWMSYDKQLYLIMTAFSAEIQKVLASMFYISIQISILVF